MGIRFACEFCGEKLHLKDQYAGKKTKCPACKATLRIPLDSTIQGRREGKPSPLLDATSSEPSAAQSAAAQSSAASSSVASSQVQAKTSAKKSPPTKSAATGSAKEPQSTNVATLESALAKSNSKSSTSTKQKNTSSKSRTSSASKKRKSKPAPAQESESATPQAQPTNDSTGSESNDPATADNSVLPVESVISASGINEQLLSEAPEANWYVAPVAGGQFGPANVDIMRQWIEEGRVTPDSQVWRDGWEDWRPASVLLGAGAVPPVRPNSSHNSSKPALKASTAAPASDKNETVESTAPESQFSDSKAKVVSYYKAKSRARNMGIFLIACLTIVSVALVGVLVYVLTSGNTTP